MRKTIKWSVNAESAQFKMSGRGLQLHVSHLNPTKSKQTHSVGHNYSKTENQNVSFLLLSGLTNVSLHIF